MKKSRQIDFNRDPADERGGFRRVLIALAAVLALGVIVFTAVMAANDFDFDKFIGAASPKTSPEESTTAAPGPAAALFSDTNAINVLLLCSNEKDVSFCVLMSFSAAENSVKIKPVSSTLSLEFGGRTTRIAEIFYNYGAAEVAQALGDRYGTVHRWIALNEAQFKALVQKFGNVSVYVPADVDFTVDAIRYRFARGTREMTADALLAVMKQGYSGDNALKFQAEGILSVLKTHLTGETLRAGEALFTEFINTVESNITAFDYAQYRQRLESFLDRSPSYIVIS